MSYIKQRISLAAFLLVALTTPGPSAKAADIPHLGLPAGPGSAQDQFQRFQQRQRQLNALPPPSSTLQPTTKAAPSSSEQNCVLIHKITVEGNRHIGSQKITQLTNPYQERCLTIRDINSIVNDINNAYIIKGYITSRAYLPEQHLSTGTLKIVVIEGKLAAIDLQGRPRRATIAMAFPWLHAKILNLRDLEQGIEQMNRLPHWGAQMHIAPGQEPGTSKVIIETPDNGIFHGQGWVDNLGQSVTGRRVGHAMLMAENPLGLLDLWSVEYDHSLRGPDHGFRGTELFSFSGSIPWGYWTFFGSASRSQDSYPLQSGTELYNLSGSRTDWQVGFSRVLLRNKLGVTSFQASIERKGFASAINHTVINMQTGHQSYVNLSLSESLKALGGIWYVTAGTAIAIDAAGTDNYLPHPSKNEPHSSYLKPSLDIDGYEPLTQRLSWHTTLHAEISTHDQFSTNQLQVGGPYSVRGFIEQALIGNNGGFMRNDFSWTLPTEDLSCGPYEGLCHALFDSTQLYGIFDFGIVRAGFADSSLPKALRGGEIVGAGAGLRKTTGPAFWNISITHAVHTGPLPSEGVLGLFSAGLKL
ncbi:hypothetical protein DM15PD_10090 [Aristophania vespae]|nr:hypothetical protein DM15PD_10090 [Aristophania vespae]